MKKILMMISLAPLAMSCGGDNTNSKVEAPGAEKSTHEKVLESGAEIMQSEGPLKAFSTYLDGFHFYNGNLKAQMEAHHYTAQLNEDVYQAIIFDGNGKDAKIMGIEYIITDKLFKQLSEEEKRLWHSHVYEVKLGELIAPGLPEFAELELMKKLVSTYGKTIHTWHTDQNRTLPLGSPMLMMGFTKAGQLNSRLVAERDARFKISTKDKKDARKKIPQPTIIAGANAWEQGQVRQFTLSSNADSALQKHQVH
ncbi:OBAP family protein [uncultured Mucilaginibacter sp.]|uniref:OBAP family protein n=1 Tax=uncultured Mucilaginibacter sp. TaxID=797541 RepID=UPI0025EA184A|nr:OBAP family protein [uncultured Mucilaginibacter sp.]